MVIKLDFKTSGPNKIQFGSKAKRHPITEHFVSWYSTIKNQDGRQKVRTLNGLKQDGVHIVSLDHFIQKCYFYINGLG